MQHSHHCQWQNNVWYRQDLSVVFLVSIPCLWLKCSDQKLLMGGKVWFAFHFQVRGHHWGRSEQGIQARTWSRNYGGTLLAGSSTVFMFSYIPKDHLPRDGTTQSGLWLFNTSIDNQDNPPQTCRWPIWSWQFFNWNSLLSFWATCCQI